MPLLPPPQAKMNHADASAILNYADGLVYQSFERSRGKQIQVQRNYNLYLGNHWTEVAPDDSAARYVFNRIKTIIVAHAAIQNGQRPKITLLPRNSGRKGACFINTTVLAGVLPLLQTNPELHAILSQIPPECMTLPPDDPQPLPRVVYEMLDAAIEQGQMLVQQAQQMQVPPPKVLPPDLIVEVSDETAAEALQKLFDAKWEECNADYYVITDSFYNGIIGWQHMYYHWDDLAERHTLHLCEFPQVFLDPTRTDICESQTAVWDYILSEEQALAEFPEFATAIDDNFTVGKPAPAGAYTYKPAGVYQDITFRQKMGTIRFVWVRNQPYPMSADEALQRGLIVQGMPYQEKPNAQPAAITGVTEGVGASPADYAAVGDDGAPSAGEPSPDAGDPTTLPPESPDPAQGGVVNADGTGGLDDGQRDAGGAGLGASVEHPTAYLLVENGQATHEVTPWGPGWPMRRGIREIVIIANTYVADRECADANIPLTHNVNFPHMFGPLGQGTPEDLELLNMAVNEVISDLVFHVRQESFPSTVISQELQKQNPDIAKELFRRPGTALTAPGDLMRELKDVMQTIEPPTASPDIWNFLTQMLDLLDKQGDMAQVVQGETNPGMSGTLFGQAIAAAQGSVLFRAKRGETMLKYLANLMLGGIKRMSTEAMAEACPDTPIYVWEAFKAWFTRGLAYDIHTEITAGGGAAKQQKAQNLINAASSGKVPISPQTLMESMDLDAEKEAKNNREWAASMQPPMPEPGAAQPGGAEENPPPSNTPQ